MARPVDLAAERAIATSAVRRKHLIDLTSRYGILMLTIMEWVGISRVRIEGDHFVPDDNGIEMVIIICWSAPPRLLDGSWQAPEPIDLLAFRLEEPGRWWSRVGIVTALGVKLVSDLSDAPIRIWKTPLQWLQAGGAGICLTTRDDGASQHVLCRLPTSPVAMDVEHGRELDRIRTRCWTQYPPILVADPEGDDR